MAGEKKTNRSEQDKPSQEFENFQRLLKDTLAVPREELDKRRGEYERDRKKQAD